MAAVVASVLASVLGTFFPMTPPIAPPRGYQTPPVPPVTMLKESFSPADAAPGRIRATRTRRSAESPRHFFMIHLLNGIERPTDSSDPPPQAGAVRPGRGVTNVQFRTTT